MAGKRFGRFGNAQSIIKRIRAANRPPFFAEGVRTVKYIIVAAVAGLLIMIVREWDGWMHDICDCMVNRALEGDETE